MINPQKKTNPYASWVDVSKWGVRTPTHSRSVCICIKFERREQLHRKATTPHYKFKIFLRDSHVCEAFATLELCMSFSSLHHHYTEHVQEAKSFQPLLA